MPDYQALVDAARAQVHGGDRQLTDELRNLAAAFADACRSADARLRRCEDFLRRGLRAEALHLAEVEPPLLEVLALLDFPERARWDELTAQHGLPSGPPPNVARAGALNQAYADQPRLEPLLRENQRLAVARAPLRERLVVLRRLAAEDPRSPIWAEDARTLEEIRLRDLLAEAQQAHARADDVALRAALAELEQTPWLRPVPAEWADSLRQMAVQVGWEQARQRLPGLARDLSEAVRRRDVAAATALSPRWHEEAQAAALDVSDPLHQQVGQALAWLGRESRKQAEEATYQQAVESLTALLGAPRKDSDRINEAYFELTRHRRGVPGDLEAIYRRWLELGASRARRREQLGNMILISVSVPILIAVCVFVGWVVLAVLRD
jgi:hypothetical protein